MASKSFALLEGRAWPLLPMPLSTLYAFSFWNPEALFDPDKGIRALKEVQPYGGLAEYYNISMDDWHIWKEWKVKYGKLRLKYMPVTYEALLKDPNAEFLKRANDLEIVFSYW